MANKLLRVPPAIDLQSVLISLASDSNLASSAQTNGNDILFTDSSGTSKLNHEIESYVSSTGQLIAWVQVPSVSPTTNTVIYMYYGNSSAGNQQSPTAVWDSNYVAVNHFAGPPLSGHDSTSNANNGTLENSPGAVTGKIGDGASFGNTLGSYCNSDCQYVQNSSPGNWPNAGGPETIEFWVNTTNASAEQFLFYGSDGGSNSFTIIYDGDGNLIVAYNGGSWMAYVTAPSANAWHHFVYTTQDSGASGRSLYIDGVSTGTFPNYADPSFAIASYDLGAYPTYYYPFDGSMDELRVSKTARSRAWIATEYNNQNSPSGFFSEGSQQTNSGSTVTITVTSAPSGLSLSVNGTACTAPCSFQWTPGSNQTIAVSTSPQGGGTGTQYAYANWSDSGAQSHSITVPSSAATYTANFTTQYYLTTSVNPSGEGTISPASEWVNSGTNVSVSGTANSGYQFTGFSGALSGATTPQNLTMTGPASVAANFSVVSAATSTTAANASATFSSSTQNVTLSATVTSGVGTVNSGTVTFTVLSGGTAVGSAVTSGTVATGSASATYMLPGGTTAGSYTIQAVYNPGAGFLTSSDSTHTLTVSAASLYISDSGNSVIRQVMIPAGIITTVAGNGTPAYGGDGGLAASAELSFPQATIVDSAGNLYIADSSNSVIRKMTATTGAITTIAGNGTSGYTGDGGPAASAELGYLLSMALDGAGNIYIADFVNNVIRKVTAATGIITTVVGNGTDGYTGDTGPANSAELNGPFGVALDGAGNLFIADSGNNVIRKVTATTGVITTIAGNGTSGYTGDGGAATGAELNEPFGVALDSSANLYIADSNNNVIRKVTASTGSIATIAGNGTAGYSGDSGSAISAELNEPFGIASDGAGNLYIADSSNNVIRQLTAATGVITTIAGNGTAGYTGEGGLATSAELNGPNGVMFGATITAPTQVITPTFSPTPGVYATTQTVTIMSATPGALINYTTDTSTPSNTAGMPYTGPITIGSTTTVKAIAYATGYTNSAVATAVYSVQPAPSLTNVTPTSGAAGTQVTISGSNFGSTQGSGAVWLGSTLGTVVSWSNTQIVATVSTGATSGTAQVYQGGVLSGGMTFTVNTATVSNVNPPSGLPGTQVTILGSGFGATQGNGQVWLGTMNGTVQSWSDTEVVALVGAGSATGNAQVLQNGVWSPAVSFIVNTPNISGVSPTSGAPGTNITITGTGFGTSQGSGTILLGSMAGVVQSWNDTQVVASVATGSLTGIVRIQQNGYPSNVKAFTVSASGGGGGDLRPHTVSGGSTVTLLPNLISMAVGDTHTIEALNASGQSVTGLTWTSTNSSIVSLSTDDPPILTALAAGHVTITAGTAATDVTVAATTLTVGTVLWSSPGDGSGVASIIPAVPSATGVADVFALQNDGNVQAITSDGTVAWTAPTLLPQNQGLEFPYIIPDFQGGLTIIDSRANSITKVNGITGQAYPTYTAPSNSSLLGYYAPTPYSLYSGVAVHPDGTIFAVLNNTDGMYATGESLVGIDPTTGAQKFNIPLVNIGGGGPQAAITGASAPIVAGDGYAYVAYQNNPVDVTDCTTEVRNLILLRVSSSGAFDYIPIQSDSPPSSCLYGTSFGVNLITNADTGVILSWGLYYTNVAIGPSVLMTPGLATTNGTGVSLANGPVVPGQLSQVVPVLQVEDGSFVGSVSVPGAGGNLATNMVAFDASGNVRWMVPNETPQIATADGGVIGTSGTTYDKDGNATGQGSLGQSESPGWLESILGTVYSAQSGAATQIAGPKTNYAATFAALVGGNASGSPTAIKQSLSGVPTTSAEQLPDLSAPSCKAPHPVCGNINAIELLTTASPDFIFQTMIQNFAPNLPGAVPKNTIQTFTTPNGIGAINVTKPGQEIRITISGAPGYIVNPFYIASERVDPTNHVISVVTLAGHPLAGWRYWRVYSIGTNDVVIETGAYDAPGPGRTNYVGYYLAIGSVKQAWQEFMRYIQINLGSPAQGTHLATSIGGISLVDLSPYNGPLLNGYWDYSGAFTNYILNNVCLSTSCH